MTIISTRIVYKYIAAVATIICLLRIESTLADGNNYNNVYYNDGTKWGDYAIMPKKCIS